MRAGDPVTIQTEAYPDVFHGRISYIAASLDPNTRTLQARIETSNPRLKLKKDMYVVASVDAGTTRTPSPCRTLRCCATPRTSRSST